MRTVSLGWSEERFVKFRSSAPNKWSYVVLHSLQKGMRRQVVNARAADITSIIVYFPRHCTYRLLASRN